MELTWYDKLAIKLGLSVAEHRSPEVKKIISELSSPALWACLATAVPLVVQLFGQIGNPHLAALGGSIMAVYAIAVQLKDAFLHVPPPGAAVTAASTETAHKMNAAATALTDISEHVADSIAHAEDLLANAKFMAAKAQEPAQDLSGNSAATDDQTGATYTPEPPAGAGL